MSDIVLPHTIDAGTDITAVEHQANYVAIRDIVNGELEGGATGNLKVDSITAREMDGALLRLNGHNLDMQPGVHAAGDLKITPSGGGLGLAYATGIAMIYDSGGLIDTNFLTPVSVTGATVTVGAAHGSFPRIDQIVLTLTGYNTGTVSVVAGTATAGATLDNRTGAAVVSSGNGVLRLADILVPAAFAGPFVQNTHIRDRRQWALGINYRAVQTSGDFVLSPLAAILNIYRFECSGAPLEVNIFGAYVTTAVGAGLHTRLNMDGVGIGGTNGVIDNRHYGNQISVGTAFYDRYEFTPAAGSHTFQGVFGESNNDVTLLVSSNTPLIYTFREHTRADAYNSGA